MPGFLYYAPHASRNPSQEQFHVLGLQYAISSPKFVTQECGVGPPNQHGHRGFIYAANPAGDFDMMDLRYTPTAQTWHAIPGTDAWVGFWNDRPPTPADLARDKQVGGYNVELGDGNQWLCPVARKFDGGECALPARTDVDANGRWIRGALQEKHAQLWETACAYWDGQLNTEDDSFSIEGFEDIRDAALQSLSVNYRLGKAEVVLLDLFKTDEEPQSVLLALVDYPEVIKKKLSELSQADLTSSDGGMD